MALDKLLLSLWTLACALGAGVLAGEKPEPPRPTSRTSRKIDGWTLRVDDRLLQPPNRELGVRILKAPEAKLADIKAVVQADRLAKLQAVTIVLDLSHGQLDAVQYHPHADWLEERGYPLLKGASQFFLDTPVEHPTRRWLVTCPSNSPENFPASPGNGPFHDKVIDFDLPGTTICAGSTIDMQILRDLFDACIEAGKILDADKDFCAQVARARARLAPMQIGKRGNLQEWIEDWGDLESKHRHISHLYGLFPSGQIAPAATPKLAEAAKVSLNLRGDAGTGFGMAWKAACWARLLDGEHALHCLANLVNLQTSPNLFSKCFRAAQADLAMAVVNIKISKFGGLTKARQARDLCVSLGLAMTIEDSWGGDITTAAIAHLAHSTPPEFLFSTTDFNSYVTVSTADGAPRRVRGRMAASTGPGLGCTPKMDVLGKPVLVIE